MLGSEGCDMYTIGLDSGTLSVRAVLVDARDGAEIAESVFDYPHGVMDEQLPSGLKLAPDWALQHPQDYLDVFAHTVPAVLKQSGVAPGDIKGIGIDFTASSPMPTTYDGAPVCCLEELKG
ncbi:MAG: FGGY family carbohydrate kinase, partial [Chloroflexi bacterium]|nr:FGGY family carbohydrate kinase [Chloroflexota bacterium]